MLLAGLKKAGEFLNRRMIVIFNADFSMQRQGEKCYTSKMLLNSIAVFIAEYLYLLVLIIALMFFILQPRAIKKSMILCGIIVAPLAFIISRISSIFYYDPRPFVIGHFTPLIAHAADNGFPSDHTLLAGTIAMIVWFYDKKWSIAIWILALLIGAARVYAGIHHVADIAGSILIAIIAGLIYYFAVRRRERKAKGF